MDRDVITAFAQATIKTFDNMCALQVSPRRAKTAEELMPGGGVHAIIGMTGQVEGAVVLSISDQLSLTLVGDMIGMELTEMGIEIVDGVQELNNILIGAARSNLASAGFDFSFGLPKTMTGMLFATDEGPSFRNLAIVFSSPKGEFKMHLSWKRGTGETF